MELDDPSGLPAENLERIRNIISFLQEMADIEEARSIPSWRAHQLTGKRKGVWSLVVKRNWRITFRISRDNEIIDLNYEDYH